MFLKNLRKSKKANGQGISEDKKTSIYKLTLCSVGCLCLAISEVYLSLNSLILSPDQKGEPSLVCFFHVLLPTTILSKVPDGGDRWNGLFPPLTPKFQ
jgi:hypothetical protein